MNEHQRRLEESRMAVLIQWQVDEKSLNYFQRWLAGYDVILRVSIYLGLAMIVSGATGCIIYSFIVVLPVEVFYHTTTPETYYPAVAALGCVVLMPELITSFKKPLLEAIIGTRREQV